MNQIKSPPVKGGHRRKDYDFTAAMNNRYAAQLKQQITIRCDQESISYFKATLQDAGIPYQSLINLYPRDGATLRRKLNLNES